MNASNIHIYLAYSYLDMSVEIIIIKYNNLKYCIICIFNTIYFYIIMLTILKFSIMINIIVNILL